MDKQIVSIDWCEDTITEKLPWDEEQFVTVRRLTGKEKRRKLDVASSVKMGTDQSDEYEINMRVGAVKDYEWNTCITDFLFKSTKNGKPRVDKFNGINPAANQVLYDHISGELEKFIDDLIDHVNKDDKEVAEVSKNSKDS